MPPGGAFDATQFEPQMKCFAAKAPVVISFGACAKGWPGFLTQSKRIFDPRNQRL
jgi:hypothetical protein